MNKKIFIIYEAERFKSMKLAGNLQTDDFLILEGTTPVIVKSVGVPVYDFNFRQYFNVQSVHFPPEKPVIARIGAFSDYQAAYSALLEEGIQLIHTPEEHNTCSLLPLWYPLLHDLTPKSLVFEEIPTVANIEQEFNWPIFVKGERQTHKHKKSLSIIENPAQFRQLTDLWKQDSMLHWQKMVCRQFVPLALVETPATDRIPASFEFRLFFWKQNLVGMGRYWYGSIPYSLKMEDEAQAVSLATKAAQRLSVCFLVVDVAKTASGNWIVIEVNDGQESGYAGISPASVWENMLKIEKT